MTKLCVSAGSVEIVVPLYKNRAPIQVTAPVPAHMHERLRACGWRGDTLKSEE